MTCLCTWLNTVLKVKDRAVVSVWVVTLVAVGRLGAAAGCPGLASQERTIRIPPAPEKSKVQTWKSSVYRMHISFTSTSSREMLTGQGPSVLCSVICFLLLLLCCILSNPSSVSSHNVHILILVHIISYPYPFSCALGELSGLVSWFSVQLPEIASATCLHWALMWRRHFSSQKPFPVLRLLLSPDRLLLALSHSPLVSHENQRF